MNRCYIITAYVEGNLSQLLFPAETDYIICADGGREIAAGAGISPHMIIGDFDSSDMLALESKPGIISFPREKDVSDTFLCVEHAISLKFDEIIIAGGIGGRLDHTISNIQTLARFSNAAKSITMLDEFNIVTVIENTKITIKKREGYTVSLFSLSGQCNGVTTAGLKYPLMDAELEYTYPLGLSNEFVDDEAIIGVKKGKLLIVMSKV